MKRIFLVDNYDSFTYNLAQLLEESKLCTFSIVKNDAVNLEDISEFDKILISPGPGLPEHTAMINEIIEHYHEDKAILGICLGMQAIAEYFGGELYNLEKVFHGIKANTRIIDKEEILFAGLPDRIETGLYHSWAVFNDLQNTDLIITAVSGHRIIMGVRHKTYDVRGIQFHPESHMTKYGHKIIENWLMH
jgi:anthranilate synthase component 2